MKSHPSYQDICNTLPYGVFILNSDYGIEYWNKWLEVKTSRLSEDVVEKKLDEVFTDHECKRFIWALDHVFSSGAHQIMSQALNHFLIPIEIEESPNHNLSLMQQHVEIAPLTAHDGSLFAVVSVLDVTSSVVRSSALVELAQKLQFASTRDPLTGIYNRRFLWDWLLPNLKFSLRKKTSLVCLMMDLDHFKQINDSFGHDVGDRVLKEFVDVIRWGMRDSDILTRYGGEEFVMILLDNDLKGGIMSAERMLEKVNNSSLASFEAGHITCSIGVSVWDPENPVTAEELLKEADKRLYKAKNNGRNQVVPSLDSLHGPSIVISKH